VVAATTPLGSNEAERQSSSGAIVGTHRAFPLRAEFGFAGGDQRFEVGRSTIRRRLCWDVIPIILHFGRNTKSSYPAAIVSAEVLEGISAITFGDPPGCRSNASHARLESVY
jgi:hypothetical protein